MSRTVQKWAFVAPRTSTDLGQYFAGILDAIREAHAIFLHSFVFSDPNVAAHADMDGIISYTVPPKEVMEVFDLLGKPHPPMVVLTMCKPSDPSVCYAHIDPHGVAERVAELLAHRHCRSYAFCSPHTPYTTDESASLRLDLLAKDIKSSNEPIKTLVARSGFGDMSRAVRAFKQRFGMTMSEYRVRRSSTADKRQTLRARTACSSQSQETRGIPAE